MGSGSQISSLKTMNFEFHIPTQVIFGPGLVNDLARRAAAFGKNAFLVTGSNPDRAGKVQDLLSRQGMSFTVFSVHGEPTVDMVQNALEMAEVAACDMVIGFGGGSALDLGKAVSAMMANPGNILDYLEVVGKGKAIQNQAVPFLAVPTTAGTGSEVTYNAVLEATDQKVKASLRSPLMSPRVAIVDPELTTSLPPEVTANTGLDALAQLIEPYVSNKANSLADLFCEDGIQRVRRSLKRAYEVGEDLDARQDMCLASLYSGIALAVARLGAVHGFANPIGGLFPGPHGAICARLLPLVMEANFNAMEKRQPGAETLNRYREIARLLTGETGASFEDGLDWLEKLCVDLQVSPLSAYGMSPEDIPALVEISSKTGSMKANPIQLSRDEMVSILERAL